MSLTYQQVAHAAMQLSPDERVDLAEKLCQRRYSGSHRRRLGYRNRPPCRAT